MSRQRTSGVGLRARTQISRRRLCIVRTDDAFLYDNTDPDRPHREVAILKDGAWWVAKAVPGWAADALARSGSPHRLR